MTKKIPYILFYWLIVSLIIPNVVLSVTESLTVWGRMANILLPLGIVGLLASISKKVGITAWLMFPLAFLGAFQLVLLSLYGNGIISVDMLLNLVTTNCSEACELLREMWPSLVLVIVMYLAPLVAAVYCLCHRLRLSGSFMRLNRRVFLCVSAIGAVLLAICYCQGGGYDIRRDLYPVNVGYNIHLAAKRFGQTRRYHDTSADFDYEAVSAHSQADEERYIIVIGETSRAHNWQICGYGRPTNPLLSKRSDLIVARSAYSESNTTHKSVPMLLSCVDSRSFDKELYQVKSLISAFKECGFHTSFISNQLPNHSYIDFFGEEADTTIFVKLQPDFSGDTTDEDLLRYVKKCLNPKHRKQLIVLHTYGSHFDYQERYGSPDHVFTPDTYNGASSEYREELVNAYDNSIVATDRLLNTIIERLEDCHCVSGMLYISDHGEDLFDDGGSRFLHSSPTPTEYQLHVPLLVWLSPEYNAKYPEVGNTLSINSGKIISTSRSFCATSLGVGGICTSKTDDSDNLASTAFRQKPLYYLDDHNVALPFTPKKYLPKYHASLTR